MTRRRALALGLALSGSALPAGLALPGTAGAAAAPATTVLSGGVAGPSATFTEVAASADCGAALVSGGGVRLAQTGPAVEHNGIHVEGSFPSTGSGAQPAGGETSPTRWVGVGGAGGGVPSDAQTVAHALCLAFGGAPHATTVVLATTPGPSSAFQMVRTTATCPAGTRMLSGGARTTPGSVGSLKPNGSFPSDAAGTPVLSGTNPDSWTATGLNGGGGDRSNTTYAFALCATDPDLPTVTVVHAQTPGPALASTAAQTTVTCPGEMTLLGGGGFVSDRFELPGSQGDHLTGSYPSDAAGTPVAAGPAASWTAASHTGGVDSGPLTQTDAWALCASGAGSAPPSGQPAPPRGTGTTAPPPVVPPGPGSAAALARFGQPVAFERNDGQAAPGVRFLAHSPGGAVALTDRAAAVLALGDPGPAAGGGSDTLRIVPAGGARRSRLRGAARLPGTVSYLLGRRSSRWQRHVPTYRAVVSHAVFPGVDMRFHGDGSGRLAMDLLLARGADPWRIAFELRGARRARIGATGDLEIVLAHRTLVQRPPRARQATGRDQRAVSARWVLHGPRRVGIALGRHDRSRPLTISTTIAASLAAPGGLPGPGRGIALDAHGSTYVTGDVTLPALGGVLGTSHGSPRVGGTHDSTFVTKLDPAGRVRYTTYLGGSRYDAGRGIAVDGSGNAYVAGATGSTDFPATRSAFQRSYGGGPFDAFAAKLDPSGTLVYATLLGDTHYDEANAIAVDAHGRAVVAGRTVSPQFPAVRPLLPHVPAGAFVAKLDRDGGRLLSSTVVGGADPADHGDAAFGVAVDRRGATYLTGVTNSDDFPAVRALQPYRGGGADAFVVKLDAASRRIVYSTYLGGSGDEVGRAIAAGGDGAAHVAGITTSRDLPTAHPLQPANASPPGGSDAFAATLGARGDRFVSATYLGGGQDDSAAAVALGRGGSVWVAGQTASSRFPLARPLQGALGGGRDAFVAELGGGSSPVRSTYLGGAADEAGLAVAVGRRGGVRVAGQAGDGGFVAGLRAASSARARPRPPR